MKLHQLPGLSCTASRSCGAPQHDKLCPASMREPSHLRPSMGWHVLCGGLVENLALQFWTPRSRDRHLLLREWRDLWMRAEYLEPSVTSPRPHSHSARLAKQAAFVPCSITRVLPRPGLARCHALLYLASDSLSRARKQGKTERPSPAQCAHSARLRGKVSTAGRKKRDNLHFEVPAHTFERLSPPQSESPMTANV